MRLVASYAISLALSVSNLNLPVDFLTTSSLLSSADVVLPSSSSSSQSQSLSPPLSPQMLSAKGIAELSVGDFQNALDDFTTAITLAEKSSMGADRLADLHVSRGIALENLKRWDEAINEYQITNNLFKKEFLIER